MDTGLTEPAFGGKMGWESVCRWSWRMGMNAGAVRVVREVIDSFGTLPKHVVFTAEIRAHILTGS